MDWFAGLLNWLWGLFGNSESKLVKAIREKTVELCGFLPTVETVVALVAVNNPAVTTAIVIAKKICMAVSAQKQTLIGGSHPVIVDGVVIEGEFINPKEGK